MIIISHIRSGYIKLFKRVIRLKSLILILYIFVNFPSLAQDTTQSQAFKDNLPVRKKNLLQPKYPSYPLVAGFLLTQEANEGDPFAQHELGLRYLLGKGFPKDTSSAVYWIQKAVSQNITAARFNYGIMLMNGIGVDWNPFEAYKHFKYSAQMGMPEGQFAYAVMLTDNLVVNKNLNEAYIWIKRAADAGFQPAIESLEDLKKSGISTAIDTTENKNKSIFIEGDKSFNSASIISNDWGLDFINFDQDTDSIGKEADEIEILLKSDTGKIRKMLGLLESVDESQVRDTSAYGIITYAAEMGSPEALYFLGRIYEEGVTVRQDSIKSLVSYIRSYRLGGYKSAEKILKFIQNQDLFFLLSKKVEENDTEAMYAWSALVAIGFDFRLPEESAFELLKRATELKYLPAIVEFGLCYYSGTLTSQNKVEAIKFWEEASELGSIEAKIRLAFYKVQEFSDHTSVSEHIKFLENASNHGAILATTALAYCYEKGLGVTINKSKAANLYRGAAQRGNRIAYESLNSMYDEIRPQEDEFILYEQ